MSPVELAAILARPAMADANARNPGLLAEGDRNLRVPNRQALARLAEAIGCPPVGDARKEVAHDLDETPPRHREPRGGPGGGGEVAGATPAAAVQPPRKYRNVPTYGPAPWGGQILFDSALEARVAGEHALEQAAGDVLGWSFQVSIPVGKGPRGFRRHRVDFLARLRGDRMRITEAKGFDHPEGLAKRRDLEAMGFVVVVRRA